MVDEDESNDASENEDESDENEEMGKAEEQDEIDTDEHSRPRSQVVRREPKSRVSHFQFHKSNRGPRLMTLIADIQARHSSEARAGGAQHARVASQAKTRPTKEMG